MHTDDNLRHLHLMYKPEVIINEHEWAGLNANVNVIHDVS